MFYLILAILGSSMVSINMRLSEGRASGKVSMLTMNYITCLTLAGAYMGFGNVFPGTEGIGATLGMGIFNGILYLLGFILLRHNVKKNGVVLSATFIKLGLLVPMVVSVCFFKEKPALIQIIGFCVALAAIVLINFEKNDGSDSAQKGSKISLLLLLLAGGGADAMSKVFEEVGNTALTEQFLFYTFGAALVICVCVMLQQKEWPGKMDVLFGLLVGIPNYYSSRFLLLALEDLKAVIVYPTYSVSAIAVVTLTGVCFFKEKLKPRQWIAIGTIMVALVLLNI